MGLLELASSLDNAHRYTVVGALVSVECDAG